MKNRQLCIGILVIVFGIMFVGCDDGSTDDTDGTQSSNNPDGSSNNVSYPYVISELEFLGRANLSTSYPWPTDTEINNALLSVIQNYNETHLSTNETHPSTDDDLYELDGVIYEMDKSSITSVTGAVPKVVFDSFWNELKNYSAGLWSCWGYSYCSIPSKGATSQAYIIYAICDDKYAVTQGSVSYIAAKAILKKK